MASSSSSSSSSSPCAACKFLRRKCHPECVFAPYFPPDQPQKFANVHKVFGASNVTKLLNELHPHQREDAVNSLAYEADMRLRDPVYGCVGVISLLQHQLRQLHLDLSSAKSELSKYQNLNLLTAAHHHHHHHLQPPQPPPPQTLAGGVGFTLNGGGGGGGRDHHYYHHQFFPRDQSQMMMRNAFDATSNHNNHNSSNNNNNGGYDGSVLGMNVSGASIGQLSQFNQSRGGGDLDLGSIDPS